MNRQYLVWAIHEATRSNGSNRRARRHADVRAAIKCKEKMVSYPVAGMNRVMLVWAGDGTWHDPGAVVFEWDLAHTVTVYRNGANIDSFSVGDPAKSTTSSRHVQRVCREYLAARS